MWNRGKEETGRLAVHRRARHLYLGLSVVLTVL